MSRKRPLVLSESENESQYYPGKPNNTFPLVESTYRDAWARFYEWDEEDSKNTIRSLRASSTRPNGLPAHMHDEPRSESGLRSSGSPLSEETFSVVEYDEQNGSETVTVGRIQGKDAIHEIHRNLSYDSCTPISRNIHVGDDSDTLAFLPFADDPTFDWKDFVDQHAYCSWRAPSPEDQAESFVAVQVALELVERHGISVEEIDRTAVSPVRLLNSDCERGVLARDDLGDWFRHVNTQPGADCRVFLPRSLIQSVHPTEAPQINLGTDVFCSNLNCIISCCTTHFDDIPPPRSVIPTLMSTQLSYDILDPCNCQCFLYEHTNTIPSNWTAEELEALTLSLRFSPDTTPCDLAIICRKPCYEVRCSHRLLGALRLRLEQVFRWRKRLISDNTIEKAKLGHKSKVVRRSEAILKETRHVAITVLAKRNQTAPVLEIRPIASMLANAIVHASAGGADAAAQPKEKEAQQEENGYAGRKVVRASEPAGNNAYGWLPSCRDVDSGLCKNVSIQRGLKKEVEVREGVWGLGCFVLEPVAEDEFILEYVGELLYEETVLTRERVLFRRSLGITDNTLSSAISTHRHRNYVFTLNETLSIDAERAGNESRYINHDGVRPNCRAGIKLVNGEHRIGLYANWDLEPGTELLLDYGPDYFKDKAPGMAAGGDRKNPATR
ncbi:hypothetical protein PQX77_009982 [Marasmius sp. AFHP31]|nr:hypothetical protein PQX77_009982 [Marasmius sp. AFHP31]